MSLAATPGLRLAPLLTAFLLAGLLTSALGAQDRRYGREITLADTPLETERGYLFVHGAYLPPPYRIEANYEAASLSINGTEYRAEDFDLSGYANRGFGTWGGRGAWGPGFRGSRRERGEGVSSSSTSSSLRALVRDVAALQHGAMVVLPSERPAMVLWTGQNGTQFLEALLATQSQPQNPVAIPDTVLSPEKETWEELVAQFQPTADFVQRATVDVEKVNATLESNKTLAAARIWSGRLSYPLTMFGLVLVVVAFGHLLINAQPMFFDSDEPQMKAHVRKATVICLLMVGLMSAIDLFWTLLASQQGSMRELNPLGNQFIGDASQLILFKTVVTGFSLGLLFWFRHLPFARRASWWCCLVLTLLTARWLTFHSLFA